VGGGCGKSSFFLVVAQELKPAMATKVRIAKAARFIGFVFICLFFDLG
jgi:hypothetical protein